MVTVVESTIAGVSPDYATIALWEADTDVDLVAADELQRGQLQVEVSLGATAQFFGVATVDATRFRELTFGGTGSAYDPIVDTGAGATGTNATGTLRCQEELFRFTRIHIENTGAGNAFTHDFAIGDAITLDGCTCRVLTGAYGISITKKTIIRNTICIAEQSTAIGAILIATDASDITIENCVLWTTDGNEAQVGINMTTDDTITTVFKNVIAMNFGANLLDFRFTGASTNGVYADNGSSDASAPGAGSFTNEIDSDIFTDPDNHDFTLLGTGEAADTGEDLSARFTTSFDGTARTTPWDKGAYDFVAPGDIAPIVTVTRRRVLTGRLLSM